MSFNVYYVAYNTSTNDYETGDGGNHTVVVETKDGDIVGLTPVEDGYGKYHVAVPDADLRVGERFSGRGISSTPDVLLLAFDSGVRPSVNNVAQDIAIGVEDEEVIFCISEPGKAIGDIDTALWHPGDISFGGTGGSIARELTDGWYVYHTGDADVIKGVNLFLFDGNVVLVNGIDVETSTPVLARPAPNG